MASKIEWTQRTWNVVTGCTKCSPGCRNCYANRQVPRLIESHPQWYSNGFVPTAHNQRLNDPRRWRKASKIFVCSMGDLFHEQIPDAFLAEVFGVMRSCDKHVFQVLTKRAERMASFATSVEWPANVWAGTTIEHNDYVARADELRKIPARVRFLSCEPLMSALPDLDLNGIHQVIVGGESGPGWRPMDVEWARDIRDRCVENNVAFFFKQYAGLHPKKLGRLLDGRSWDEMPGREESL